MRVNDKMNELWMATRGVSAVRVLDADFSHFRHYEIDTKECR